MIAAVIGNPVLHSLSPVLMHGASYGCNIPLRYLRLPVKTAQEAYEVFEKLDLVGLNITAPFKKDMVNFCHELTDNARNARAVNCIYRDEFGMIWGDNTDIEGVELTLKTYPEILKTGKMLVFGSGGATNAVILAGKNLNLDITVCARNQNALEDIKQKFNVKIDTYQNITELVKENKIIVQALPSGVKVFEPELLTKEHMILDANYKNSIFLEKKDEIGYKFLSGKNWLVNQAVPSFEHFTGVRPSADFMYKALEDNTFSYQKRIAFTGFMGVGKTTVGKKLSALTGYEFFDLDDEIEKHENMKIKDIFSQKGEEYFRSLEKELLINYTKKEKIILSLGGGTIKSEQNREILNKEFLTIWLYGDAAFCTRDLDVSNRPLLQVDNILEKAEELIKERIPMYADSSFAIFNQENSNTTLNSEFIYEQINTTFGI